MHTETQKYRPMLEYIPADPLKAAYSANDEGNLVDAYRLFKLANNHEMAGMVADSMAYDAEKQGDKEQQIFYTRVADSLYKQAGHGNYQPKNKPEPYMGNPRDPFSNLGKLEKPFLL